MGLGASSAIPLPIGEELPPRVQEVTQEGIDAFHEAFGGSNPIHTDPAAARQRHLGAPVQHGVRTLYPIVAMLFERYPQGLVRGGGIDARFIAPVSPGDVITCHCRAIERRREGTRQVLVFEAWAVNQLGKQVLAGTAAVVEENAAAR